MWPSFRLSAPAFGHYKNYEEISQAFGWNYVLLIYYLRFCCFLRLKIFFMLSLASFQSFSKIWNKLTNTFYCNIRNIFHLYKLIRLDLPVFPNIVLYRHLVHPISNHHCRGKVRASPVNNVNVHFQLNCASNITL